MFKDLLVATTGQGDDAAAFAAACALAGVDGHVAVLVQERVVLPAGGVMAPFPVEAFVVLHEQAQRQGEAACARWREALRLAGVAGEVRFAMDVLSSPPQTAALHSHYADLAVVGLGAPGVLDAGVAETVARLLSESGRPVLVVPKDGQWAPPERIAIAWRPGASAARVVHEALPLLARARVVDVLCVDPHRGEGGHGDDPGADIARHLARHGLAVTVHVDSGAGGEPADVLLRRCRELGAGLLVMGGRGRSRLHEWLVGGTTRHVLAHAPLPVLLAQ
jgi:nucleotide-binding universal stress UspA family protein